MSSDIYILIATGCGVAVVIALVALCYLSRKPKPIKKMKEPKYKKLDTVFYAIPEGYQVDYIKDVFRVENVDTGETNFGYNLDESEEGFEEDVLYPSLTALKAAFDERFDQEHPDYAPREIEVNRSAVTGRFESDEYAKANPDTTVTEHFKREY